MFIDESGKEHQSHYSKYYILLGCIIEADEQQKLSIRADQIKYRYFKNTNVVLHGKDIANNSNEFVVFSSNDKLKDEFLTEITQLIHSSPIKVTCCIVDKKRAYSIGWKHTAIIQNTADAILRDFLNFVYSYRQSRNQGIIIYEASGFEKDAEYLKAFNKVLTPGFEQRNPEFSDIRDHLTSVTFATKLNKDIECELADFLSYAAYKKYQLDHNQLQITKKSHDFKMIKTLEAKLLKQEPSLRQPLGTFDYMSNVVGFHELPIASTEKVSDKNQPTKKKRTAWAKKGLLQFFSKILSNIT